MDQDQMKQQLRDRDQMPSEGTLHDEHDRAWFNSGWEACRREVLAMAEHRGDAAAVDWVIRHPAHSSQDGEG
jgi:hypothetical protein